VQTETFGDWDDNNDEWQKNWNRNLIENLIMVALQMLTNLLLLVPFMITGMA
jgi:hypothetical protein